MTAPRQREKPEERDERDERDEQAPEPVPEEERPLDSGTVQALREADPRSRAQALLRLQRQHGNAAVQRVIRSLELTDAGRDARIQAIGDKAEEPVPSGALDKAVLYREAVEAELDRAPPGARSERDLVQDNVNTIGQIFTNYQAALHLFERAATAGAAESVPRELAKEILREAARGVFEPVLAAAARSVAGLDERITAGFGVVDDPGEEVVQEPGSSAPAHAIRNLVIAERRRVAAAQAGLIKGQARFFALVEARVGAGDSDYRSALAAASDELNELEATTHRPERIFQDLLERWQDAAKGDLSVQVVLTSGWKVAAGHIRAPRGAELASQLLQDGSGWFDLNDLRLVRHVTWEASELGRCEALLDPSGVVRQAARNERGGPFLDDFVERLRADGLPRTKVLSGD